MAKELNQQQIKYCHLYVETSNQYQSAIDAGFSKNTAKSACNNLMKNPLILSKIEEIQRNILLSSDWSKSKLIAEIQQVYQQSMADNDYTNALKSLDLIGKYLGHAPTQAKQMEVKHSFERLLSATSTAIEDHTKPVININ